MAKIELLHGDTDRGKKTILDMKLDVVDLLKGRITYIQVHIEI
jgi:hypothetical protein